MNKGYFAVALAVLINCFFAGPVAEAQNTKQTSKVKNVREGVGLEGIRIGRSTMADVAKKFGKGYKLKTHKKYSYQMIYPGGISFYYCQSDKRKEIFDIEIRVPYEAKTSRGVVLGKSTLADIYKLYGKQSDGGLQYRGVSFFYANYKGKKVVTVIDIVESSGIRQCRE